MTNLIYTKHEKISLKSHADFNERWVQERIEEDPSIVGLGDDLRLIDSERTLQGGGRLDLLLVDDDQNRRYEVELQLGRTDASHIVRCIEYWDLERRKYPGYDHVAVIIAEDVTSRFLNVISLMAGSIPIIAIQLDALQVGNNLLLNFLQVLDQTDLRTDDDDGDAGGKPTDRSYWEQKAGSDLMSLCDNVLERINSLSQQSWEFNFLRGYFGLKAKGGSVNNFIHFAPKRTKNFTHIICRNSDAADWAGKFEAAGIPSSARGKNRLKISVKKEDFDQNESLIMDVVKATIEQFEN